MDFNFINHGEAEAAIDASTRYAEQLENLTERVRQLSINVHSDWHGESYEAFSASLRETTERLASASAQAHNAATSMRGGLEQARHDEDVARRDAERREREEEEARRRAQADHDAMA